MAAVIRALVERPEGHQPGNSFVGRQFATLLGLDHCGAKHEADNAAAKHLDGPWGSGTGQHNNRRGALRGGLLRGSECGCGNADACDHQRSKLFHDLPPAK